MPDFPSIDLLLIRHAQARNAAGTNYDDASLSPLGRAQAAAVGRAVADRRPDALYTSPAPRAAETAASIAAAVGLAADADERLGEYLLGSVGAGLTAKQLHDRSDHLRVWQPDDQVAPDGESLRQFAARVAAALEEIVARHLSRTVVIVAHAGSIDAALRWVIGMGLDAPWMHSFAIDNASITELTLWPQGRIAGAAPRYAEFLNMGSAIHLPDDLRSEY